MAVLVTKWQLPCVARFSGKRPILLHNTFHIYFNIYIVSSGACVALCKYCLYFALGATMGKGCYIRRNGPTLQIWALLVLYLGRSMFMIFMCPHFYWIGF